MLDFYRNSVAFKIDSSDIIFKTDLQLVTATNIALSSVHVLFQGDVTRDDF